jgi:Flp pilus assembly pilin Flp
MTQLVVRLLGEEQGQDLIEYALLSSLLAVACIGGILQLSRLKEFLADVGVLLRNAL